MTDDGQTIDRFLHVADLHFWQVVYNPFALLNKRLLGNANVYFRRSREFVMERAEPYVDRLAEQDIPFVLLTGDFTSTATPAEFARSRGFVERIASKGLDLALIPGNHDVYTFESMRRKRFEQYLGDWFPKEGLPASSKLPGGTTLILVPTVCPNLLASSGRITDDEIARVKRLLDDDTAAAGAPPPPLVVAGHYPLLHETHAFQSKPSRRLHNAEALRRVLGESGRTILYVAGHEHRFLHCRDPDHGNVTHLVTGAFFLTNHREDIQGEFAEVHVNPGGFAVFRHCFKGDWRRFEAPRTAHDMA